MSKSGRANPIEYRQNQFNAAIANARDACSKMVTRAKRRRYVAHALKGIALFGGIAMTAGLRPPWSQAIGIVIAVAVTIDQLSSNHTRLIADTEAHYAYQALIDGVIRSYNQRLAPVLDARSEGSTGAPRQLSDLLDGLIAKLHDGQTAIEEAVQKADMKALMAITVANTPSATHETGRD